MILKEGVSLAGLKIEMRKVLLAAKNAYDQVGSELVVTSGTDGAHSPGSYHYYGYALDFRTRHLANDEILAIINVLESELPEFYDVCDEGTHIHVEYDYEKALQNQKR